LSPCPIFQDQLIPMWPVPFPFGEPMVAMSWEDVARDIAIALAVVHPPVQVGRGRRLPGEVVRAVDLDCLSDGVANDYSTTAIFR
ncbi:MAG: hypothetical protein ACHQ50_15930, partial [Fimbriimonadales bacterium]